MKSNTNEVEKRGGGGSIADKELSDVIILLKCGKWLGIPSSSIRILLMGTDPNVISEHIKSTPKLHLYTCTTIVQGYTIYIFRITRGVPMGHFTTPLGWDREAWSAYV